MPTETLSVGLRAGEQAPNGAAVAAFAGAGVGAFAMGVVILLSEAGMLAAPTLYGPAGGVSGRTALATMAWLLAWGLLHGRWKGRDIQAGRIYPLTVILIGLGVIAAFPPLWALL